MPAVLALLPAPRALLLPPPRFAPAPGRRPPPLISRPGSGP
jgi:hypothetical protein